MYFFSRDLNCTITKRIYKVKETELCQESQKEIEFEACWKVGEMIDNLNAELRHKVTDYSQHVYCFADVSILKDFL